MKKQEKNESILMGNEAIARGMVDNGCSVVTSYPGTPSSEILSAATRFAREDKLPVYLEWSVNEKSAFEVALSNSYMGCRSGIAMKQVGLNVASDSLMSAAYTGVIGGFLIVSADDPGPHSSQTEQDSRLMALFAKIPVLDPASPREAYKMVGAGLELSERYGVPVMLRPTTRICHARQNVTIGRPLTLERTATFEKNPSRWAATPKFRYQLHKELNKKLDAIGRRKTLQPALHTLSAKKSKLCLISSGAAYSYVLDILVDLDLLGQVALYKVPMPHPLDSTFLGGISKGYKKILVVEETYPVIEFQMPDRRAVWGKLNGYVPRAGELTPDVIYPLVLKFSGKKEKSPPKAKPGGHRPSLCPGCPHRASYFAIRKALPKGIYPGDIGCYTLGINLGGVDTCLCMGASINQAAGFYHSFTANGKERPPIAATIGDSTFIHSGFSALINAVYNKARFIVVILDNSTTAMTGNQPTAATGVLPDGSSGKSISLEKIIEGCGVTFLKVADPYDVEGFISVLKDADAFTRAPEGGVAVVIARHACIMNVKEQKKVTVTVSESCTGCQSCIKHFECPALVFKDEHVDINQTLCNGCGVCIHACPVEAIEIEG
jgi:indolepyruvate ferredoxin oxidoreductase alpha subunit